MSEEEDYLPLAPNDPSTERLVNLFMLLQSTVIGFTRDQIFEIVPGYLESSDAASQRMFERDKDILLSAGIYVEMKSDLFANEHRYLISKDRVLLPELKLEKDELKALYYASLVWNNSDLRESARELGIKLQTFGLEIDTTTLDWSYGISHHLPALLQALQDNRVAEFDYRKPQQVSTDRRTLEVWGVTYRPTNWYVFGLDRLRNEPRAFNLRRIVGECVVTGPRGAYEIPDSIDVEALLNPMLYAESFQKVTLRVMEGKGLYWRKLAKRDLSNLGEDEFDVELVNPFINLPRLAADAPGVVVVGPNEIRNEVLMLLQNAVGAK
ncbi:MAG: helix-turn-helix transcriptional regulator [Candidatus Nanopelagicales bacterium]